jgi:hypothetical protein
MLVGEEDGEMEIIDVNKVKRMVELCYPGARRPTIGITVDYAVVDYEGEHLRDCVTVNGLVLVQVMTQTPSIIGPRRVAGWRVEEMTDDDPIERWEGTSLQSAVLALIFESIKPELSMEIDRAYVEMFEMPKCECIEDDCQNH